MVPWLGLALSLPKVQFQFLFGELRFHQLLCVAKKKKKKKSVNTNFKVKVEYPEIATNRNKVYNEHSVLESS